MLYSLATRSWMVTLILWLAEGYQIVSKANMGKIQGKAKLYSAVEACLL
jgi:hypothetical protein